MQKKYDNFNYCQNGVLQILSYIFNSYICNIMVLIMLLMIIHICNVISVIIEVMLYFLCTAGKAISSTADTCQRVLHTCRDGGNCQVQESYQEETQVTQEGRRHSR